MVCAEKRFSNLMKSLNDVTASEIGMDIKKVAIKLLNPMTT
jgi:hypothetical protein